MAESYFEAAPRKINLYQQCLVLFPAQGEQMLFPIVSDSIEGLISQGNAILSVSERQGKTKIKQIVCMWENKEMDTPSIQFLKRLCEFNAENRDADILRNAGNGVYAAKMIADMIG